MAIYYEVNNRIVKYLAIKASKKLFTLILNLINFKNKIMKHLKKFSAFLFQKNIKFGTPFKAAKGYLTIALTVLFCTMNYSQIIPPCGAGYSFTITNLGGCYRSFYTNLPAGAPPVTDVTWQIWSNGTNNNSNAFGRNCDETYGEGGWYQFCFNGYHQIRMILTFEDGSKCMMSQTVYITCPGSINCQPNASAIDAFKPGVTIAWNDYAPCDGMYMAIVPIQGPACAPIAYTISYTDGCGNVHCNQPLGSSGLYNCLNIKPNSCIRIRAEGNHCCYPSNFIFNRRIFISATLGIANFPYYGICHSYCAAWGCSGQPPETPVYLNGPNSSCQPPCPGINGEDPDEIFENVHLNEIKSSSDEQIVQYYNHISILNGFNQNKIDNIELFDLAGSKVGSWKSLEINNIELPSDLIPGIYILKYSILNTIKYKKLIKY